MSYKTFSLFQIFLLLFLLLYISSYTIIGQFRRKDAEDYITDDEDDVTVYQIRYSVGSDNDEREIFKYFPISKERSRA